LLSSFSVCKRNLIDGNLAVLPTETVYGLAANGYNPNAVGKIFQLKGRPATNPVILHISGIEDAYALANVSPIALKLANKFWPGPLTLLLKKKESVPSIVTASLETVALRSPLNKIFRRMLAELPFPLAAPSANPSNRTSPTTAEQVVEMFGKNCPPVFDGGQTVLGIESTVVDLTSKIPTILRPGHVTALEIEECLSCYVSININEITPGTSPQKSPGSHKKHYSPKTPTILHLSIENCVKSNDIDKDDLVFVYSLEEAEKFKDLECTTWCLSKNGNCEEIAHSLFKTLHKADNENFSKIHLILLAESDGLTLAINDRIARACGKAH
jgi:L-threonylcarbamoyladenylate synthase